MVAVPLVPLKDTEAGLSKTKVVPTLVCQVVPAVDSVPLLPLPVWS